MAQCPHCQFDKFKLEETTLAGTTLMYAIVSCDNCGAPVGVLEQGNLNSALEQQESVLDDVSAQIGGLETKIDEALKELRVLRERTRNLG